MVAPASATSSMSIHSQFFHIEFIRTKCAHMFFNGSHMLAQLGLSANAEVSAEQSKHCSMQQDASLGMTISHAVTWGFRCHAMMLLPWHGTKRYEDFAYLKRWLEAVRGCPAISAWQQLMADVHTQAEPHRQNAQMESFSSKSLHGSFMHVACKLQLCFTQETRGARASLPRLSLGTCAEGLQQQTTLPGLAALHAGSL